MIVALLFIALVIAIIIMIGLVFENISISREYERFKSELEDIKADIAEKENRLGFSTESDIELKNAYLEMLQRISELKGE